MLDYAKGFVRELRHDVAWGVWGWMRFTAVVDYDVALTAAYKRGSSRCDCALRGTWLGLLRLLSRLGQLGDADNIGNIKLTPAARASRATRRC